MSIAILVPTRKRIAGCKRLVESIKITMSGDNLIGVLFATDEPERSVLKNEVVWKYCERYRGNKDGKLDVFATLEGDGYPTVAKWNNLARLRMASPEYKLFMLGSDDMYFDTPGWDKALLDHYNALENKIHCYALQDSRDPDGTPHPIVTREWIEAMGYFIPPIFLHWFADTWTVDIAKANNCFTHMRDFKLIHDKPSDRGEGDETHSRIRQWGWYGRDRCVNDTCQHFMDVEETRLREAIDEFDRPDVGARYFGIK